MTVAIIPDPKAYLGNLKNSIKDKLKILEWIPDKGLILDVGCADGELTEVLYKFKNEAHFVGVDINRDFIEAAKKRDTRVLYRRLYLRDVLALPHRFDAVLFTSVLHEFYSYGSGITSIIKALCDARELLNKGGRIIIRDQMLRASEVERAHRIAYKIRERQDLARKLWDFEDRWGSIDCLRNANHFLLKYFYTENWLRECAEHYCPLNPGQYWNILTTIGLSVTHHETYLLPYLDAKWQRDFRFTDAELQQLTSTTLIVAELPA